MAELFYARLFEIDPTARGLFRSTDMRAQGEKVIAMLSEVVAALDEPAWLVRELSALGQRHVDYGVVDSQYHTVRDALLDAMAQALGDDFDAETRDAWSETYALAAGLMRRGAASRSRPTSVDTSRPTTAP
ncbi:MAG: globin domain-containing protein [Gemmatimonadaceae bacterium]